MKNSVCKRMGWTDLQLNRIHSNTYKYSIIIWSVNSHCDNKQMKKFFFFYYKFRISKGNIFQNIPLNRFSCFRANIIQSGLNCTWQDKIDYAVSGNVSPNRFIKVNIAQQWRSLKSGKGLWDQDNQLESCPANIEQWYGLVGISPLSSGGELSILSVKVKCSFLTRSPVNS